MNVVIYQRAGTQHVAAESLQHQTRSTANYAATHGHHVVESFSDVGYANMGLWQALEVLARGEAQALLIHDSTRILRGYPDTLAPLRMLDELNTHVLTSRTGEIRLDKFLAPGRSVSA